MRAQEEMRVRPAREDDLARIAEIEVFNFRLNFYPIFLEDSYYFDQLQVPHKMAAYRPELEKFWVYDDGVVKGFIRVEGTELKKLYVEPVLQSGGIGAELLRYAVDTLGIDHLWALEKNTRAIAFYARHGFVPTDERVPEEDTEEYLVRLVRCAGCLTEVR